VLTDYHAPSVTNLSIPPLPAAMPLRPDRHRVLSEAAYGVPEPQATALPSLEKQVGEEVKVDERLVEALSDQAAKKLQFIHVGIQPKIVGDVTNTEHFSRGDIHRKTIIPGDVAGIPTPIAAAPPSISPAIVPQMDASVAKEHSPFGEHVKITLPPHTIATDNAALADSVVYNNPEVQEMVRVGMLFKEALRREQEQQQLTRKKQLESAEERPEAAEAACPPTPPGQPHVHPHGPVEGIKLAQPYKRHFWDDKGYHQVRMRRTCVEWGFTILIFEKNRVFFVTFFLLSYTYFRHCSDTCWPDMHLS